MHSQYRGKSRLSYEPLLLQCVKHCYDHQFDVLTLYEKKFIGGFKGDWEKVPSGQNQESKRKLLEGEGVFFDRNGYLIDKSVLWDEFDVTKLR